MWESTTGRISDQDSNDDGESETDCDVSDNEFSLYETEEEEAESDEDLSTNCKRLTLVYGKELRSYIFDLGLTSRKLAQIINEYVNTRKVSDSNTAVATSLAPKTSEDQIIHSLERIGVENDNDIETETRRRSAVVASTRIYPGYQFLFLFDNSANHGTYAEDALRVQSMSLKPGGLSQKLMRPGYMHGDLTQVQEMSYIIINSDTGVGVTEAKGTARRVRSLRGVSSPKSIVGNALKGENVMPVNGGISAGNASQKFVVFFMQAFQEETAKAARRKHHLVLEM
ncbi:hypothetical protein C7212DRAFT_344453 [Tuber magnatum]|uniref:Uncharacterized protein n=1 Tax=Tuber magnatum TaxID=42249 RepID=A0A317SNF2_9PEZI|nr:hypothetical protein C7212DRAFT_344453 [Tuber magnatum]